MTGRPRATLRRRIAWQALITVLVPVPIAGFFWLQSGAGPAAFGPTYLVTLILSAAVNLFVGVARVIVERRRDVAAVAGRAEMARGVAFIAGAAALGTVVGALIVRATLMPDLLGSPRTVLMFAVYFLLFLGLGFGATAGLELTRRLEERVRADQDLRLARRIQSAFLPARFPAPAGCDVHAVNVASREVSGDFYDVVEDGGGALLLAIADVSGKGLPASLLTSMLQASLRTQATTTRSVAAILDTVDRLLLGQQEVGRFATFFLARLEPVCGRLTYCNAGHNPPLVCRAAGGVDELTAGGTVLGILKDQHREEAVVDLHRGDRVVLYTDGITEAAGADGLFGEQRLRDVLETLPRELPSREVAARVLAAVDRFTGGAEPDDDRTLLVLRVAEAA